MSENKKGINSDMFSELGFKVMRSSGPEYIYVKGSPTDEGFVPIEESSLDKQVGGNHYKDFAIQPVEFIQKNKLGWCEGNIVKYICRYEQKNGKQDLEKVKHYVDLLIDMKYSEEK